jgi:hypothetical protein
VSQNRTFFWSSKSQQNVKSQQNAKGEEKKKEQSTSDGPDSVASRELNGKLVTDDSIDHSHSNNKFGGSADHGSGSYGGYGGYDGGGDDGGGGDLC